MAKLTQIKQDEIEAAAPIDIVEALATGAKIIDATLPFLKQIWDKIAEFAKSVQTDAFSTPKGKRKAIEALQQVIDARNVAQAAQNKIYDAQHAETKALFEKLKSLVHGFE